MPGAPAADFSSQHAISIAASPQRCYDCIRTVEMGRSPLIRAMLSVRGLRRMRTLDDALDAGFILVAEDSPHRLTLGLAGKPWRPSGHLQRMSGPDLIEFDEPGFVKVLWHFVVDGSGSTTTVTTSTEVFAADGRTRRAFGRYWRIVGPFSGLLRRSLLASVKVCAEAAKSDSRDRD